MFIHVNARQPARRSLQVFKLQKEKSVAVMPQFCKSSPTHGTTHAGSTRCHWFFFAVMLLFFARLPPKIAKRTRMRLRKTRERRVRRVN